MFRFLINLCENRRAKCFFYCYHQRNLPVAIEKVEVVQHSFGQKEEEEEEEEKKDKIDFSLASSRQVNYCAGESNSNKLIIDFIEFYPPLRLGWLKEKSIEIFMEILNERKNLFRGGRKEEERKKRIHSHAAQRRMNK